MRVDLFDFDLPEERIALRPAQPRERARLLHVPQEGALDDRTIGDLPALLRPGDVLVFNDTKVIPAQLEGRRIGRGDGEPRVGLTLHQRVDASTWKAFVRGSRKLRTGDHVRFEPGDPSRLSDALRGEVIEKGEAGEVTIAFPLSGSPLDAAIAAVGTTPLPPYIASKRPADDRDLRDYQTIYSREEGAVAAPTAGLHFTPELLSRLTDDGISCEFLTLHVGAGTFLPVKAQDTRDHRMHSESGVIDQGTADRLNVAKAEGRRIVSVGAFAGPTDIFITPGYRFRVVDRLLTNFHLPRSTLFMLVSAFSGLERMKAAYAHAIRHGYRFYSYGDACLLDRAGEAE